MLRWTVFVCAVLVIGATVEVQADKKNVAEPKPLPDATARSWQDLGARVGWIGPSIAYGQVYFDPKLDAKYMDPAHTVPGIIVQYGRVDFAKLKTVAPPEVPFALWINNY